MRDALALAAGELVRVALGHVGQEAHHARAARRRARGSCVRVAGDVVHDQRLAHDVAHLHARVERAERVLEDHLHARAAAAASRARSSVVMSRPRTRCGPTVGSSMRRTASAVVDLPQPLSPTSPSVSPRRTRERHAVDRLDRADLLAGTRTPRGAGKWTSQVLDAEDLVGATRRRGTVGQVRRATVGSYVPAKQALRWRSPTVSSAGRSTQAALHHPRSSAARTRSPAAGWRDRAAGPRSAPARRRRSESRRGTESSRPRV